MCARGTVSCTSGIASSPSIPGIERSSTITSGSSAASSASIVRASPASPTTRMPSSSTATRSSARSSAMSSQRYTLIDLGEGFFVNFNQHRPRRGQFKTPQRGVHKPLTLVAGPEAVHDAAAREVVRRQLDANAVARVHPDPEPPHLSGGVAERLVPVVEVDPEHAVPQRLDDLAGHLDLLFLVRYRTLLKVTCEVKQSGGGPSPPPSPTRPAAARWRPAGPSRLPGPRTPPSRLRRATCS